MPSKASPRCTCCGDKTIVPHLDTDLQMLVCSDCKMLLRWAQAYLKQYAASKGVYREACPDSPDADWSV